MLLIDKGTELNAKVKISGKNFEMIIEIDKYVKLFHFLHFVK